MKAIIKNSLLLLCVVAVFTLCIVVRTSDYNKTTKSNSSSYTYTVRDPSILNGYSVTLASTNNSNPMNDPVVYNDVIKNLWNEYEKKNTNAERLSRYEFVTSLNLVQTSN